MNIMDFLRKLGIFRSGAVSSTYKNGNERPTEFMMDDVFNAKKDLTKSSDYKGANSPRWLKWVLLLSGLLLLVFSLAAGLFWFLLVLIVWGYLFLKYDFLIARFSLSIPVFLAAISILWIILVVIVPSPSSTQSASELKKHDEEKISITSESGDLNGMIQLEFKEGTKTPYLMAHYIIQVNTTLGANGRCIDFQTGDTNDCPYISYQYANNLVEPGEVDGEGSLSIAYCHFGEYPSDIINDGDRYYSIETCGISGDAKQKETTHFVATFARSYTDYDDIFENNGFEIYDASDFNVMVDKNTSTVDTDEAVKSGKKVKSYEMTFKVE